MGIFENTIWNTVQDGLVITVVLLAISVGLPLTARRIAAPIRAQDRLNATIREQASWPCTR